MFWLIGAAACGTQVSDEYLGEPLLSMRGSVTLNGLTAAPDITPALCFREELPEQPTLQRARLPAAIQADLHTSDGVGSARAHVVDVQTLGEFPTEFSVDVYTPPPDMALRARFPGEPRAAFGAVCAVTADHPAVVQQLVDTSISVCSLEPPVDCTVRNVRSTGDASVYYSERFVCTGLGRPGAMCQVTRDGDPQLLAVGGGYEAVYGVDRNVQVLYLAEPAPPGSYTAYRAGARDGLAAGYHLIGELRGHHAEAPAACLESTYDRALAELNREYGTSFDGVPGPLDDTGTQHSARELIDRFNQINARLEMEACPIGSLALADVSPSELSIELRAEDPSWQVTRPWPTPTP